MAGRRRSLKKRNLPPNLYESGGYYRWRNPATDEWHSLGKDRGKAIAEAVEANVYILGLTQKRRLVDRLSGIDGDTVAEWCHKYRQKVESKMKDGDIAKSTSDAYFRRIAMVEARWNDRKIGAITTRDVADFISTWADAGKKRMAQAMRSFLVDFFNAAAAAGWIAANPATLTETTRVRVSRARLTFDEFTTIYEIARRDLHPWAARAMELALITGQRREDIRRIGPRDAHDGKLWIEQQKTGNRVCIPVDLRLQAVNWSVAEVIARCRDNILSRHFIHHTGFAGRAKPGDPIRKQTLSAAFAEARDKSGLSWPDRTPPTFHEIRSLSARLWAAERGKDFAQAILGHKSEDSAALYRDPRGAEWIEVRT